MVNKGTSIGPHMIMHEMRLGPNSRFFGDGNKADLWL